MSNIQILNKEILSDKKYPLKYISFEKLMQMAYSIALKRD
jgi:hypothetical protein